MADKYPDDEPDEQEEKPVLQEEYLTMEANLYRCNCPNDSGRVDIAYHAFGCKYRKWYLSWKGE